MPTIPQTILAMAAQRAPDKTVCPFEIACELFPTDWRRHVQEVRDAAIELHQSGKVTITQKEGPLIPIISKGLSV